MKPAYAELPELPQFVAARDVRRALGGASNATINNLIADGTLPQPIKPRRNMMLFPREPLLQAFARMAASG
jgi:predicted DNA-binding transcriptional regulator AlpA